MKLRNYLIAIAILTFASGISSCKKDNNNKSSVDTTTEAKTQADDQTFASNESDAVTNDANASIDNYGGSYNTDGFVSGGQNLVLSCDASVAVDTTSNPNTLTITYSGSCNSAVRTRTGTVILSFAKGFKWGEAGAQLTIKFVNLKITRKFDSKSITINGTRIVTNVNGGLLRDLATVDAIEHKIDDTGMSITFDNGSQRTWETHFVRDFSYNNGMVISTTGAVTGENRYGDNFSSTITQALVVKQSCDFRLVSGSVTHTGPKVNTTITFGLDLSGNPVTDCPLILYFKVVLTGSNGSISAILPY